MENRFSSQTANAIYRYILERILSGNLKPGDKLAEMLIAQALNVSRTPVRDGLRELAAAGVITLYPNKYAELAVFNRERVCEVGITKITLDRLAVRLAIYFGSRAEYGELRRYADNCYRLAMENNYSGRVSADSNFHMELCRITKNRTLAEIERNLLIQLEYLQSADYLNAEDPAQQYADHMKIVDALESGDVAAGLDAITKPSLRFYYVEGLPKSLYEG